MVHGPIGVGRPLSPDTVSGPLFGVLAGLSEPNVRALGGLGFVD